VHEARAAAAVRGALDEAAIEAFRRQRDRWINQYPQAVLCLDQDLESLLICFDRSPSTGRAEAFLSSILS